MTHIPYNKNLKVFSQKLRNDSTLSEVLLWQELRAGKMKGSKFNRQKPLLNYIVDFYGRKLRLVIEIDGASHNDRHIEDQKRQKDLEEKGLSFLRFDDLEVKKNMSNVLRSIQYWIEEYETKNPPNPLEKGDS
jgi:very-short-patch-repair endonuclease